MENENVPPCIASSPFSRCYCRALDCILEPGKRVLEVGSGLGYWAYLLKIRSGDDSRVHCLDPYAPEVKKPPSNNAPAVKNY